MSIVEYVYTRTADRDYSWDHLPTPAIVNFAKKIFADSRLSKEWVPACVFLKMKKGFFGLSIVKTNLTDSSSRNIFRQKVIIGEESSVRLGLTTEVATHNCEPHRETKNEYNFAFKNQGNEDKFENRVHRSEEFSKDYLLPSEWVGTSYNDEMVKIKVIQALLDDREHKSLWMAPNKDRYKADLNWVVEGINADTRKNLIFQASTTQAAEDFTDLLENFLRFYSQKNQKVRFKNLIWNYVSTHNKPRTQNNEFFCILMSANVLKGCFFAEALNYIVEPSMYGSDRVTEVAMDEELSSAIENLLSILIKRSNKSFSSREEGY